MVLCQAKILLTDSAGFLADDGEIVVAEGAAARIGRGMMRIEYHHHIVRRVHFRLNPVEPFWLMNWSEKVEYDRSLPVSTRLSPPWE